MTARDEQILANLIANRAETHPDLDVVTFEHPGCPDEVRTYRQLWDNGRCVAAALKAGRVANGGHFALLMQNHPEFLDAMVGASISGAVFVPIDPRTKGDKLVYMLRHSGCRGVICADYVLDNLEAVRGQLPELEWIWVIDSGVRTDKPLAGYAGVRRLAEVLDIAVPEVEIVSDDPSKPMEIMYTSGTTGDPKGVVIPHARFAAVGNWHGFLGYRPDDRPYTGLSLTHGNAQLVTLSCVLKLGMRAVISRKFSKSRLWDIARKYGCTTFTLLGGMTTAICSEPPRANDADNPVRFVISAGMPAAIWRDFERRFGVEILEFYGAVEGGLSIKPVGEGPVGSVGKPPATLRMRIVDDYGQDVAPGERGEIIFKPADGSAPSVAYLHNPEASAAKTRGGWLRMGDIGHVDADGWLFFDFRMGGAIRHNGDFVNPAAIEKVLAESPMVSDVFVYGIDAASGAPGEKDVVAAIVPEAGVEFAPDALFRLCREKLDSSSVPSYLQVVAEIPKTASEKPQERFLKDAFKAAGAEIHEERRTESMVR
ncbi:AMP-binding protein [Azoarcus sp. KH32C]|uniref:AMP-binding protein n=1 Tax=Azoarcus sp. KH32C TaxID=748247 RepID=UPI0002386709|nr:AMP-binding protein [Azoarcus sp. KH32C]BAL24207.1 AMP-dependent synthetase and ligase [Azoarcus sp. KH32C]